MSATFRTLPLLAAVSLATQSLSAGAQQLEEVIVTAQKRAESLQDVPISVTAVQGEKIQNAGIFLQHAKGSPSLLRRVLV